MNKIPDVLPLLNNTSRGISLTAPRRMGKSMTLSTLQFIKLLGLSDLKELLKLKSPSLLESILEEEKNIS